MGPHRTGLTDLNHGSFIKQQQLGGATGTAGGRRRAIGIERTLDVVGAVLWIGLVIWATTAGRSADQAAPVRDLLLLAGATYVLSRLISALHGWLVPATLATAISLVALWHLGGHLGGGVNDPLGYANASAALYVTGCAAALITATRARRPEVRTLAVSAAVACALVPWLDVALTSAVVTLGLPVAHLSRQLGVRVRDVIVMCAATTVLVLGSTVLVAVAWTPGGAADAVIAQSLSSNRGQLWQEAVDLMVSEPLDGVGTNQFSVVSATARGDQDLRWAHNEYLQLGAETGVPGFTFAVALVLWLFVRLAVGERDAGTAVAAAGLAGASIAASVDYVWHFPVVLLATAALVGAGRGRRRHGRDRAVPRYGGLGELRVDASGAGDPFRPQQPVHRPRHDPQI